MLDGIKRAHFIGLGGIGMSALARLMILKGYRVSGSDITLNENLKGMRESGAEIFCSHAAQNVAGSDLVVVSSAIRVDNPELAAARRNNIPVLHRSELLRELAKGRTGIAVAGMHGKTTTTNLITHVFKYAGFSPSYVVGGIPREEGLNAAWGRDNYFIYEADESDGSLVNYSPSYSIITNIEEEHIGYFDSIDSILVVFRKFIDNHVRKDRIYCCIDSPHLAGLINERPGDFKTYSVDKPAMIHPTQIEQQGAATRFGVMHNGRVLGEVTLNIPGIHNVSNALPVIALATDVGIPFDMVQGGLATFQGTMRRMELLASVNGVSVYDDYAHHPTEIMATLAALKKMTKGRVIAVFQPHRYSRLMHLFPRFVDAFGAADTLMLTDVYGAGEERIDRASSKELYRVMCEKGIRNVEYVRDRQGIMNRLIDHILADDAVVFMGAGDITKTAAEFASVLRKGTAHAEKCSPRADTIHMTGD
ncbi:MAG TPA: UDP-N-acetylmuramate--L-alanine ligase [bacterium]|nr:UDP-N-acetylmuramate--L-alanine ligase [bacterium]